MGRRMDVVGRGARAARKLLQDRQAMWGGGVVSAHDQAQAVLIDRIRCMGGDPSSRDVAIGMFVAMTMLASRDEKGRVYTGFGLVCEAIEDAELSTEGEIW